MEAGSIKISARLKASLASVAKKLNQFKKVLVGKTKDRVSIAYIEKLDINREPKEFFIINFSKDGITVDYVIPENVPPSVRRWTVLRKAFPIITSVSGLYDIDVEALLNTVELALQDMISLIPKDSKALYVENDKLKNKISELEAKLENCLKSKEEISTKLYETTTKLTECRAKLKEYETYPDELLKSKIITWIKEHDGEIDIEEFARVFNVPETKVSQLLKELVDENYINPR